MLAASSRREGGAMNALIDVRGVRKLFPLNRSLFSRTVDRYVRAVDGIDLVLAEDETVALVGESGSGKSTLGLLILGLHAPTEGSILWSGSPIDKMTTEERKNFRRNVQVVFQDPYGSLNPRMTVRRIIERPLTLHDIVPPSEIDGEVTRLIEFVGLKPASAYVDRYPHEFSGGQRQRIAIARALALQPRLIVADEPVSALDVSVRAQILTLFENLRRDFKITILFATHDLGVVRYIADRVVVMYLGKVVEVAPNEAFFKNTLHPYSRMLLGAALSLNPGANLKSRAIEVEGEPPSPVDPPSGCRFRTRCPFAFERCTAEEPALRSIQTGHLAACHLHSAD
jgi:oligopeptide transport system ATP-binding protein